jgi:hypothetical protein
VTEYFDAEVALNRVHVLLLSFMVAKTQLTSAKQAFAHVNEFKTENADSTPERR